MLNKIKQIRENKTKENRRNHALLLKEFANTLSGFQNKPEDDMFLSTSSL